MYHCFEPLSQHSNDSESIRQCLGWIEIDWYSYSYSMKSGWLERSFLLLQEEHQWPLCLYQNTTIITILVINILWQKEGLGWVDETWLQRERRADDWRLRDPMNWCESCPNVQSENRIVNAQYNGSINKLTDSKPSVNIMLYLF